METKCFVIAATLLSAVAFSSCNNESEVIDNRKEVTQTRVSFNIAIPKVDPVVITKATHDAEEWTMESLWLYEYKEGKLVSMPVDIKPQLGGTGPDFTYEKEIADTDKGMRQFLLVANEAVPAGITVGTDMPTLKSKLASKILAGNSSCNTLLTDFSGKKRIPMTGIATQRGNELITITGAPASVSVEMVRIVARIDIENKVSNLIITDVKLAKTNTHSHLFQNKIDFVPTGNTKVSGITPFAPIPSAFGVNVKMPKAFYLYEGQPSTPQSPIQVEVTGKLGEVPVFYTIPFVKSDKNEVVVKRNHIYRLVLGDGTTPVEPGNDVTFKIEDTPWNEVTMNEELTILAATHSGPGTWDALKRTLDVSNAGESGITFNFSTKFTGHTAFTATIVNTESWLTAIFSGNTLTVTVNPNNATGSSDREAVIEVASNADPNTKYSIQVKQPKS